MFVLFSSKLKVEDMREATMQLKEAQWESDEATKCCKQCNKDFSIARRKVSKNSNYCLMHVVSAPSRDSVYHVLLTRQCISGIADRTVYTMYC